MTLEGTKRFQAVDTRARPPSLLIRLVSGLGVLLSVVAAFTVLFWLVGRVCTDRWYWSQWLFWIPTPIALMAVMLGLTSACRPQSRPLLRRNRLMRWLACGCGIAVYFLLVEHRYFRRAAPVHAIAGNSLHIVQWNTQNPDATPEQVIQTLRGFNADVAFITDLNWVTMIALQKDPLGLGAQPATWGPLAVVSRVPIRELRPLVAVDLIYIALIEFDTTKQLGRTIRVYLVDMPSDPRISRADMMRKARRLLENAVEPAPVPEADMVIGDFNTPRGSWALSLLYPAMREAFDDGGHGYGATYYRRWPLYHIDHILLGSTLRAVRCDIVDPGQGRHRAQEAWIVNPSGQSP